MKVAIDDTPSILCYVLHYISHARLLIAPSPETGITKYVESNGPQREHKFFATARQSLKRCRMFQPREIQANHSPTGCEPI
jgi:hypothetical protein